MNPSWTDICQALAALLGVIISLVGFVFIALQLRQNQEAIDRQTNAMIYQLGLGIYTLLIEHPELRPYFYENIEMPIDEPNRSKVMAASEMLCDLFEYFVLNEKSINSEIRQGWLNYMRRMYENNQVLKNFLSITESQYSDEFLLTIGHRKRR